MVIFFWNYTLLPLVLFLKQGLVSSDENEFVIHMQMNLIFFVNCLSQGPPLIIKLGFFRSEYEYEIEYEYDFFKSCLPALGNGESHHSCS